MQTRLVMKKFALGLACGMFLLSGCFAILKIKDQVDISDLVKLAEEEVVRVYGEAVYRHADSYYDAGGGVRAYSMEFNLLKSCEVVTAVVESGSPEPYVAMVWKGMALHDDPLRLRRANRIFRIDRMKERKPQRIVWGGKFDCYAVFPSGARTKDILVSLFNGSPMLSDSAKKPGRKDDQALGWNLEIEGGDRSREAYVGGEIRIRGFLKDAVGNPICGFALGMDDGCWGISTFAAPTGPDGSFEYTTQATRPGRHEISFVLADYQRRSVAVRVFEGVKS